MKRMLIASAFCAALGILTPPAHAERLIATNWVSGTVSYLKLGSAGPIDRGWAVNLLGNANVTDNVDVQGGFSYAWADDGGADLKLTTVGADAIFSLNPGSNLNPFFRGGVGLGFSNVNFGFGNQDDTQFGFDLGIGSEFSIGSQGVLDLESTYFVVEGDGSFSLEGRYAHAFTPKLLSTTKLGWDFDDQTLAFTFGVIYRVGL